MERNPHELDELRRNRSDLENNLIDGLVSGQLSRRDFLRRGSVIGLSIPLLGAIVTACGGANSSSSSSSGSSATTSELPKAGATIKIGGVVPTGDINPLTIADEGGLTMLQQSGEFLSFNNPRTDILQPMLATKFTPNENGDVWTYKLRPGVTFNNGAAMTADDVVYSIQSQTDPKNPVNATSAFQGVLVKDGVKKVDDMTVAFHLQAPNGNFPYLLSSDNYNLIIVPANTDYTKWQSTFVGTGPFKLVAYHAKQGATFTSNPSYWGGKPLPAGLQHIFYDTQQPQINALLGGDVDVVNQIVPQGAEAVLNNSSYHVWSVPSSQHRELSMRNDMKPWTDKRVRQAMALTLNRPQISQALFKGYAQLGNDNPFAPSFRSTDKSVPQRKQDIDQAKQLLSDAGVASGFTTDLYAEIYEEIPDLAQIVKQAGAQVGININLHVENQAKYYGDAVYGKSDWLDGEMSLVDYGARGVPNVFLNAPLRSDGTWNAAHFKNPQYDALASQYTEAIDFQTQKTVAGKIQRLLLDETPLIIPYWFDAITVSKKTIGGVVNTGMGQIFLHGAGTVGA